MNKSRTMRWILLVLVVAGLGYYGWQRFHGEDQATAANNAQKAARARSASPSPPVEKTDFPVYLTGLGTVQAFNTVVVRSRVDGQIDKIAFKEGQLVKQGDLLAQIDPRPYQAALDQAKAKKEQDEANLANINLDLQRYIKLGEFATTPAAGYPALQRPQLTAQIAADAAAIDNAQTQLDYTDIKAPISGVVGLRQVDIGNIVNAATQTGIVTIAQIEPIAVIFTAPEDQLPYINEAQARSAAQDHCDHDRRQEAAGGRNAGSGQQSGRLHQRHHPPQGGVRQQGPRIVAGPVGLDAAPDPDAQGCHRGSGRRDPARHRGLYAFVVNQDNKAELRKVKVSQSIDGRSVIEQGLSPGQQVITSGHFKVQPGTLVSTAVASSDPAQPKVRQE